MAARRKQEAVDVPSSIEAAVLLRDYVVQEHYASAVNGRSDAAIAAIKASRDAELKDIEAKQSTQFVRLKAWWEAKGKDEAKGKRSMEFDDVQIGMRLTPPKLTFLNKMKEADVLGWLRSKGVPEFIRTKQEIDKPAIIKALGERDCCGSFADLLDETFAVTQKDEFYIAVAPLEKTLTQGEVK